MDGSSAVHINVIFNQSWEDETFTEINEKPDIILAKHFGKKYQRNEEKMMSGTYPDKSSQTSWKVVLVLLCKNAKSCKTLDRANLVWNWAKLLSATHWGAYLFELQ